MEEKELDRVLGKIDRQEYDSAFSSLSNVLAKNPKDVDALNLSGMVSLYLKDLKLAHEFFDDALAADPYDFVAWGEKGRCHLLRGEYAKATECLGKSSALFDDKDLHIKSQYQMLKGYSEFYAGDVKGSLASFETACVLDGKGVLRELSEFAKKTGKSSKVPLMKRSKMKVLIEKIVKKYSGKGKN